MTFKRVDIDYSKFQIPGIKTSVLQSEYLRLIMLDPLRWNKFKKIDNYPYWPLVTQRTFITTRENCYSTSRPKLNLIDKNLIKTGVSWHSV